jgi:hypothetical protein
MLTKTNYTIDRELVQEAGKSFSSDTMKTAINQPTGNFFYDPWILKEEYKGTVWETLYNSLPVDKGEARIIVLDPAKCYQTHADIDDRYHLNIQGEECFLIDLIREQMYKLEQDGIWYEMDAGQHHTATNFGRLFRIQLVVRKLLKRNTIKNPLTVTIISKLDSIDDSRFLFDNYVSPWLNSANKNSHISDFEYSATQVKFKTSESRLQELKKILPEGLVLA